MGGGAVVPRAGVWRPGWGGVGVGVGANQNKSHGQIAAENTANKLGDCLAFLVSFNGF